MPITKIYEEGHIPDEILNGRKSFRVQCHDGLWFINASKKGGWTTRYYFFVRKVDDYHLIVEYVGPRGQIKNQDITGAITRTRSRFKAHQRRPN